MNIKKLVNYLPHLAIIAAFAIISAIYFFPVTQGKDLQQMDNTHAIGAANELKQYEAETGEKAQWTNSMFGGMPAYQIKGDASTNIFHDFTRILRFGLPYTTIAILFMYMLGFYLLMLNLKMNQWVAIAGAMAFALGSYNIIIIIAGHITKAYAIALMPVVLGGIMMIFNGKKVFGGVYTAVALGMEIAYNHVQITYYLALTIMVLVIAKLTYAIKDKALAEFWKSLGTLAAATLLAILPGVTNLWTTYEYGKYSIRGASEISSKSDSEGKKDSGLDKDYAFSWSYGVHETPTLLIPNVVGGASEVIGYDNKTVARMDPQIRDIVAKQMPKYWGGRAFTSGPVYVGAIVCFLFFIGCFYYEGREKWWLIAATVFSIFLAWGKNFAVFNDLMFDYFPLYNKFRTVEMALVIATVTMPLLGMLGLKEIWDNPERIKYEKGKFFGAMGLSAGAALLIGIFPTAFYDFMSKDEIAQFADLVQQNPVYDTLRQAIIDARIELTRNDALRSAVFVILASSALWFMSVRKLTDKIAMSTIILLIVIDLWQIDRRYLGNEHFTDNASTNKVFVESPADKFILADKEPHRVMSVYTNPFNEVYTSYYHQSVGGYHGAKIRRYQDIIDNYLGGEYQTLVGALRSNDNPEAQIASVLESATALNMLNTKYIIYNPNANPIYNKNAMGAAWFVDNVVNVDNADEAISALRKYDLKRTAIVENAKATSLPDSTATIERTMYSPDKLEYSTSASNARLAVFSEIYYEAGWKAYIDDVETPILRADYILRAVNVPAGNHVIRFEFKPQSYSTGNVISTIGSILIVIFIIGAIAYYILQEKKRATTK